MPTGRREDPLVVQLDLEERRIRRNQCPKCGMPIERALVVNGPIRCIGSACDFEIRKGKWRPTEGWCAIYK